VNGKSNTENKNTDTKRTQKDLIFKKKNLNKNEIITYKLKKNENKK